MKGKFFAAALALLSILGAYGQDSRLGYTLPLSTSGDTLTIATVDLTTGVSLASGLPIFVEAEKRTGVKIKWEVMAANDHNQSIATRLAAGQGLPDIVRLPANETPAKYVANNVIIPLKKLIANYGPNITARMVQTPAFKRVITSPDGEIYGLPQQTSEDLDTANNNPLMWLVRGDWLKTLNLATPTTADQLHDVLVAFRDLDPNKNKLKDEIPLSFGSNTTVVAAPIGWLFGLHLGFGTWFYPDAKGKIQFELTSEGARQWLTLAQKWFKEGLIDPAFDTLTNQTRVAQYIGDKVGVTHSRMMAPKNQWNNGIRKTTGNPEAGFVPLVPLANAAGERLLESEFESWIGAYYSISKNCKKPELAVRWIDYITFSKDGLEMSNWGIPGRTFDVVNGKKRLQDWIINSPNGLTIELFNFGYGYQYIPLIWTREFSLEYFAIELLKQQNYGYMIPTREQAMKYASPPFPPAQPTPDEGKRFASIMNDITTFVNESAVRFIRGSQPLSEFDNYVKKIKSMGIDEAIQLKQIQYDRFYRD